MSSSGRGRQAVFLLVVNGYWVMFARQHLGDFTLPSWCDFTPLAIDVVL